MDLLYEPWCLTSILVLFLSQQNFSSRFYRRNIILSNHALTFFPLNDHQSLKVTDGCKPKKNQPLTCPRGVNHVLLSLNLCLSLLFM